MDSSQKKGRGRPKSRPREEVVERAVELYWREGPQNVSLNELCRRVDVSKPAFYREFGGEDGLAKAVLDYYRAAVVTPVLAFLDQPIPFSDLLAGLIEGMTADRGYPPGCLFTEMRMIRRHLGTDTLATLESMEAERRTAFAKWYEKALAAGEANPSLSAADAADYLDSQFTLILLHMGLERDPDAIRQEAKLALGVLTV
ncbi:MAG: TetR/AcrR family transcriptional regulator [Bradymonadia bacterium]